MNGAERLTKMLHAARSGGFALTKLNWALWFVIPFNKPHRFRIKEVGEDFIRTTAPYKRKNLNHIKGIHACGIATIAEFSTGILLLSRLDPAKYRIIMSEMKVEYFYQAKKEIIAEAKLTLEEIANDVEVPLEKTDSVFKTVISKITDSDGNHIATANIKWQLKRWDKVKTKL